MKIQKLAHHFTAVAATILTLSASTAQALELEGGAPDISLKNTNGS